MKQTIFTATLLSGLIFFACKETPKPTANTAEMAQKAADSIANRSIETMAAAPTTLPDSLIVMIDSMGKTTLGNREVGSDDLTKILVDSCHSLKKTFGKVPKTITYKSNGAMMGVRGAVRDAIEDAQEILKKENK
jgi:PBP1b-binding outer membrane lipoprotein LpoB